MKEEIEDLKIALAKFTLGKNILDIIFGKQRCVFYEARLGYNPENQQKMHKKFFASTQKASSPLLACFYCGKNDYSVSTCYIRKNGSSIGKMVWVPKGSLQIYWEFIQELQIVLSYLKARKNLLYFKAINC